ncbi:MAG: hypothetical protein BWK77_08000 [Verrucomicrobia bacterium A1]|nr:MAG: hypothetical protein BWK77_08000 [Verrucomicrobia bacterium A1]
MKRAHLLVLFGVVAVIQLAVPASMIVGRERTLRTGELFKFKTAPVDPFDAFRGRFVAVRVEQSTAPRGAETNLAVGTKVCAAVGVDTNGFAVLTGVTVKPPADGAYIRAPVVWSSDTNVTVALPLDRFYMNEKLAPQAEAAYREHAVASGPRDAWLAVRVRSGQAVIEDLYLGDRRILEVLTAKP